MNNLIALELPAKSSEDLPATAPAGSEAMQQWLDNALSSNNARDRIAVVKGISRGVFGSLPLSCDYAAESVADDFVDYDNFQRAA